MTRIVPAHSLLLNHVTRVRLRSSTAGLRLLVVGFRISYSANTWFTERGCPWLPAIAVSKEIILIAIGIALHVIISIGPLR